MDTHNTRLPLRLGYWAVLTLGALFVLYVVCFAGILASGPLFVWSGMQGFLDYISANDQTLKYVSYAGMLVFAIAFAVLAECVREAAPLERRFIARIGAGFAWLFALCTGTNYFVQLTAVRVNLLHGATAGLEQLVMANPYGAMEAVNMLGWTVFLGLACLCMAFTFVGRGAMRAARISLLACAANSLIAAVGYALDSTAVLAVCMYPGLGVIVLAISISVCVAFRKAMKTQA